MTQVAPLTEHEYSQLFSIYLSSTNEYQAMKQLGLKVLQKKSSHEYRKVLSIGTGNGTFELDLLKEANILEREGFAFVAVEPNPHHIIELRGNCHCRGLLSSCTIIQEHFTANVPATNLLLKLNGNKGKLFDIVLLSHSFYYLQDRPATFKRIVNELLADGGVIIAWIQTEGIITKMCRTFLPRIQLPKQEEQEYLLTDDQLEKELVGATPKCILLERLRAPSYLDITDFTEEEKAQLFSFILQTDVKSLPIDMQKNIFDYADSLIEIVGGRRILRHDTGMLVWRNGTTLD